MQTNLAEEIQIIPIILIGICLLLLMSAAIILFFYLSRKKIVKTELEKAQLLIEHQQEMLQTTLMTQEAERMRIAQDLHDDISSKLNIVSLHASMVSEKDITIKEANEIGHKIAEITGTVLESSRRIAHDLLPPSLDKFGLVAALEELCEQVGATCKFILKSKFQYQEGAISKEQELHIFRIVQELINNTVKYAEAKTVALSLSSNQNTLHLQYEDDGKGFDKNSATLKRGLGLSGLENRAMIIGAKISLKSEPNKGMSLDLVKKLN